MTELVFTVKTAIGGALWAADDAKGGWVTMHGSEVVTHPGPAMALMREVGADGFVLLTTLACLAASDHTGRLVVTGGRERVRVVLGWGREKMIRVFNEVAAAGFVSSEQQQYARSDGQRRFSQSRLILSTVLYQPDGQRFPNIGKPDTGKTNDTFPDVSKPDNGETIEESPAVGKPDTGNLATNNAGEPAVGFPGAANPDTMNDFDDEKESSSLIHALAVLGFSEAREVVRSNPRDELITKLTFVQHNLATIANPGGYLRRLLATDVAGVTIEQTTANLGVLLSAALGTLGTSPNQPKQTNTATTTHPAHQDAAATTTTPNTDGTIGDGEGDNASDGSSDEELPPSRAVLDAALGLLEPSTRAEIEGRLDEYVQGLSPLVHRSASMLEAMRNGHLGELLRVAKSAGEQNGE